MQSETSLVAILEWVVCHKDLVPSSLTAAAEEMLRGDGEISVSEFASLHRRVGFLEGFLGDLEMLSDEELRQAIERDIKRYREIQAG